MIRENRVNIWPNGSNMLMKHHPILSNPKIQLVRLVWPCCMMFDGNQTLFNIVQHFFKFVLRWKQLSMLHSLDHLVQHLNARIPTKLTFFGQNNMARVCFLRSSGILWSKSSRVQVLNPTCCIRLAASFNTMQHSPTMLDLTISDSFSRTLNFL